jgi:hypothetical protein
VIVIFCDEYDSENASAIVFFAFACWAAGISSCLVGHHPLGSGEVDECWYLYRQTGSKAWHFFPISPQLAMPPLAAARHVTTHQGDGID